MIHNGKDGKVRTLVLPEDIFPFARPKCAACLGAGKFTARKNLPNGKLDELAEHICPCAIKRFLDKRPNVDIDLSPGNAGAMYFVAEAFPENPEPTLLTAKELIDEGYAEFAEVGPQR